MKIAKRIRLKGGVAIFSAALAIAAVAMIMVFQTATSTGCLGGGECYCKPSICPNHVTTGCTCRVCDWRILECARDTDCIITDELCCSDADSTNQTAININYLQTWQYYRNQACNVVDPSLWAQSHCAPGCGTRCTPFLVPACSGGICIVKLAVTVPDGGTSPYTACMTECKATACDGGPCGDAGAGPKG